MNLLSVEALSKRFGEREIFRDLSFGISQGEKVGLIAKNGTGKTTLLNILNGVDEADSGRVVFRKDTRIAYLNQNPAYDPEVSVWKAVFDSNDPILNLVASYERCLLTGEGDLQKLLDQMEEKKAWDTEARVKAILTELQVDFFEAKLKNLSGGQLKRLFLAKVMLQEPKLLILDEPTNHLDLNMIEWLEQYLKQGNISLLMVTHDRYFLERVCNQILELDDLTIYSYPGNYSKYIQQREERKEIEAAEIDKAKNLYRRELDWMRRQPKARTTKSKARIDAFYNVEERASKRLENKEVEIEFNMERLGSKVLEAHSISKAFGELKILESFNYKFIRGERVGIIGPNGVGKSTFIKLLTAELEPDAGKVVIGETVHIAHYLQEGLIFKKEQKVIEVLKEVAEYIPLKKGKKVTASQLLERFLFDKKMHYQHVEKLSGGEKRRLHLLRILMKNPNFIILDEPTNDLDILTINVLENFLQDFPGCIIVISHDRYFMDKLVDHLFVMEGDGKVTDFPGNYSLWREKSRTAAKEPKVEKSAKTEFKSKTSYDNRLSFNEKREYGLLEKDIEKLEKRKVEIESIFENEDLEADKMTALSEELGQILDSISQKEERWFELSEKKGDN